MFNKEDKEGLIKGTHSARKSRSPQAGHKTLRSNSLHQNRRPSENLKKTNSTTPKNKAVKGSDMNDTLKVELSPKTEELNEKKKNLKIQGINKRPNTATGCSTSASKKTYDVDEKDRNSSHRTKSTSPTQIKINWTEKGITCTGSSALSVYSREKKQFNKKKCKDVLKSLVDLTENSEPMPLVSLAILEQERIIEMLRARRENLENSESETRVFGIVKSKTQTQVGDCQSKSRISLQKTNTSLENIDYSLRDFYYNNNLDEIFQVWIHLFCFIINLRINLIRIVNAGGVEAYKPNTEVEREMLTRAIESVKFFSKLKMKSLVEYFEDIRGTNFKRISKTEMNEYEEKLSSPFILDMEFIGKKARELLCHLKKENEKNSLMV